MHLGQADNVHVSAPHQTASLCSDGLSQSRMPTDALAPSLSLLPPDLLQSNQQHLLPSFASLASSPSGTSASLLPHVQKQLQPTAQSLIAQQQARSSSSQQTPLPVSQPSHQQKSHQPAQQQPRSSHHREQQQKHEKQQRHQHQLPSGQQANIHLNAQQQHPSSAQPQQPPSLAHLLGSIPATLAGSQPSLVQEHASILNDARSAVSSFSQSLCVVKQATPADQSDIRNIISLLERASQNLASELNEGCNKLRALSSSPAYNNMAGLLNATGASLLGQGSNLGHDLFGGVHPFGMPDSNAQQPQQQAQQQQQNMSGLPFDLGIGFQQQSASNGIFNLNGTFSNDIGGRANGQQGAGANTSPFLPALLAQYLSQSTDPSSRNGALSLFQSLNNGNANGPFPNSMQGLDALLNQGLPHQQHLLQHGQQTRTGMSDMDRVQLNNPSSAPQLANGAPLTNAAALTALTSLGITPTMLEALGLNSVAQQMLDASVDSGRAREASIKPSRQAHDSPGIRDENPKPDQNGLISEPARKKRKHGRSRAVDTSPLVTGEANSSKQTSDAQDPSTSRPSQSAPVHITPSKTPTFPAHLNRNPNNPNVVERSDTSRRIPTLGVGLRQEGDKRYRNRKLLRDLREHLYRWLGTDEFRKLRNTYKVAEWVPNPRLTEEEKRILASLPAGAVAQPPITTHIFHVDFTSRDYYRTNQSLIEAIVAEASRKVEAKPEAYSIVPGTIDRDHLEDVAKDLMDSARSGFRMSLRTGLQAEKEDKEKHEKYRGAERAKTKCRNREIGAGRLRHAIPKQLLIPGAYSDDAASDEDLHGLTRSEWKRQRLRKLRIAKGWEAVTPKWRNKHLTRAYHKADIVSKSKQMARWRRDDLVDLPIPIKLYGKLLPKQLFDPDWLAEHRKELEDEPYCIRINDNEIDGWDEAHHPLGEDTSDEMEWSDTKESVMRDRHSVSASGRHRGNTTNSPASATATGSKPIEGEVKTGSTTPVAAGGGGGSGGAATAVKESPDTPAPAATKDTLSTTTNRRTVAVEAAASDGSGASSVSSSSRSAAFDAGDTAGSDTDSDSSIAAADAVDD